MRISVASSQLFSGRVLILPSDGKRPAQRAQAPEEVSGQREFFVVDICSD
jgi:hypothetical protein